MKKSKYIIKYIMLCSFCISVIFLYSNAIAKENQPKVSNANFDIVAKILNKYLPEIASDLKKLANPKWEYKCIKMYNLIGENELILDKIGQQGWELITYTSEKGYIFKRRLRD